jgi:hypothetical protein
MIAKLSGAAVQFAAALAGAGGLTTLRGCRCLKDVYGFEFGSSRGSEAKTEQLTTLMGGAGPAAISAKGK